MDSSPCPRTSTSWVTAIPWPNIQTPPSKIQNKSGPSPREINLLYYPLFSRSAVRAQTGSWSWKPYTYEKKQVCDSELRFIRPGYARDSTGKWQVIVQTDHLPQRVAIDLCHSPGKPCKPNPFQCHSLPVHKIKDNYLAVQFVRA